MAIRSYGSMRQPSNAQKLLRQGHLQFKIRFVPFADSMTVHPEHIPDMFRGQHLLRRAVRHILPVFEEKEAVAESRSKMKVMQDDQDGLDRKSVV